MYESVEDGIGDGAIAEISVPLLDRDLAGNHRFSYIDPLGLSTCSDFVDALLTLWDSNLSPLSLGLKMLDIRSTTLALDALCIARRFGRR